MKHLTLILLTVLLPATVSGRERNITLEECLTKAEQSNPDLQSQKANVEEVKFKYLAQRGMLFPQLDANLSYFRYGEELPSKKALFGTSLNDYYADVSLRQVLFSGGKYHALAKSARLIFESEQQNLELARKSVFLAVKRAYYEQARSNYSLKVQQELLDKLKEQLNITQLLYNSGKVSSLDVLKLQTQIASAEDVFSSLKNLVQTRALLLGQVIGVNEPLFAEDVLPRTNENIGISSFCLENKFKDNPELKYFAGSVARADSEVSAARADRFPTLTLRANYYFEDKDFFPGNPNWYAGAGLSVPLFHGGGISAQIGQAKARQKQAVEALRRTELNLQVRFESALATAADKRNRLKTTRKVMELSQEALNASELKYNAGKLTALELIDAQTVWYNSLLTYESNAIDYLITLAEIEYICPQAISKEVQ